MTPEEKLTERLYQSLLVSFEPIKKTVLDIAKLEGNAQDDAVLKFIESAAMGAMANDASYTEKLTALKSAVARVRESLKIEKVEE